MPDFHMFFRRIYVIHRLCYWTSKFFNIIDTFKSERRCGVGIGVSSGAFNVVE